MVARHYGELFGELRTTGRVLSQVDMMVGALARHMRLTVLTTDADFSAVQGVTSASWVQAEY